MTSANPSPVHYTHLSYHIHYTFNTYIHNIIHIYHILIHYIFHHKHTLITIHSPHNINTPQKILHTHYSIQKKNEIYRLYLLVSCLNSIYPFHDYYEIALIVQYILYTRSVSNYDTYEGYESLLITIMCTCRYVITCLSIAFWE